VGIFESWSGGRKEEKVGWGSPLKIALGRAKEVLAFTVTQQEKRKFLAARYAQDKAAELHRLNSQKNFKGVGWPDAQPLKKKSGGEHRGRSSGFAHSK